MSSETSSGVFASAIVVAFLGWLGALAAAVAGVVQSRSHSVPRETSLPA
jgi:hypothetical protein